MNVFIQQISKAAKLRNLGQRDRNRLAKAGDADRVITTKMVSYLMFLHDHNEELILDLLAKTFVRGKAEDGQDEQTLERPSSLLLTSILDSLVLSCYSCIITIIVALLLESSGISISKFDYHFTQEIVYLPNERNRVSDTTIKRQKWKHKTFDYRSRPKLEVEH